MRWNPYLMFNGQCEAAFRFYEQCLGGKITFRMTYGESPMAGQTPPEWHEKILHATFERDDQVLGGVDVLPVSYQPPQGFSVTLNLKDAAEAERIFAALAQSGMVQMPIAETFWAKRFGVATDRFGTPWMINCA